MKTARLALFALAFALVCSATAFAQVPSGAPAGTTGLCTDGSYTNHATKSGACSGHKGVKTWYAAAPAPATAAKPAAPAPAPTPAPAAASTPAKPGLFSRMTSKSTTPAPAPAAPAPAASPAPKPAASAAPAAGGGPGMVWVNSSTKVYHCPTDRYYGKTKSGKYLSESAAQAEGDKPDAGKKCF